MVLALSMCGKLISLAWPIECPLALCVSLCPDPPLPSLPVETTRLCAAAEPLVVAAHSVANLKWEKNRRFQ